MLNHTKKLTNIRRYSIFYQRFLEKYGQETTSLCCQYQKRYKDSHMKPDKRLEALGKQYDALIQYTRGQKLMIAKRDMENICEQCIVKLRICEECGNMFIAKSHNNINSADAENDENTYKSMKNKSRENLKLNNNYENEILRNSKENIITLCKKASTISNKPNSKIGLEKYMSLINKQYPVLVEDECLPKCENTSSVNNHHFRRTNKKSNNEISNVNSRIGNGKTTSDVYNFNSLLGSSRLQSHISKSVPTDFEYNTLYHSYETDEEKNSKNFSNNFSIIQSSDQPPILLFHYQRDSDCMLKSRDHHTQPDENKNNGYDSKVCNYSKLLNCKKNNSVSAIQNDSNPSESMKNVPNPNDSIENDRISLHFKITQKHNNSPQESLHNSNRLQYINPFEDAKKAASIKKLLSRCFYKNIKNNENLKK